MKTKFDKQIRKLLAAYHRAFDWQGNRKKGKKNEAQTNAISRR